MKNFKPKACSLAFVLSLITAVGPVAMAAGPSSYAETWSDARSRLMAGWVDAQAKLITAQATMITAIATANATDAKAMETLEQVRGLSMDNNLKRAKFFYEKKTLNKTFLALQSQKRPSQEEATRYGKASAPQRLSRSQIQPARGKIYWPQVLQREEFADSRLQLECLFNKRQTADSRTDSICQEAQDIAVQMQDELRPLIRQVSPSEYLAARKFIDGLALEAQSPSRIEAVASN